MKTFLLKKKTKNIKVNLISTFNQQNQEILKATIVGPLGSINYEFKNIKFLKSNKLFIEENNLNFFIKKIKKLIKSVTNGWFVELNLNGLGFKSFKLNDKIALDLGYSNLIIYKPTEKLIIKNFKNKLVLFSLDEEYLRNICNTIQSYSIPDAYKGKGILYKNQIIRLKKKAKS